MANAHDGKVVLVVGEMAPFQSATFQRGFRGKSTTSSDSDGVSKPSKPGLEGKQV